MRSERFSKGCRNEFAPEIWYHRYQQVLKHYCYSLELHSIRGFDELSSFGDNRTFKFHLNAIESNGLLLVGITMIPNLGSKFVSKSFTKSITVHWLLTRFE